jgi:hypothetical protein
MPGKVLGSMTAQANSRHNRRQFIAIAGSVLLAPPISFSESAIEYESGRAFSGSLKNLVKDVAVDVGFGYRFDALIESMTDMKSEWIIGEVSKLGFATKALDLVLRDDIAAFLRSRGVRQACEVDCQNGEQTFFLEITVFESARRCRSAWQQLEDNAVEAALTPCTAAGESMFVSRGGWSLPGKAFVRRGNIVASVLPVRCQEERAIEFARKLDRKMIEAIRPS